MFSITNWFDVIGRMEYSLTVPIKKTMNDWLNYCDFAGAYDYLRVYSFESCHLNRLVKKLDTNFLWPIGYTGCCNYTENCHSPNTKSSKAKPIHRWNTCDTQPENFSCGHAFTLFSIKTAHTLLACPFLGVNRTIWFINSSFIRLNVHIRNSFFEWQTFLRGYGLPLCSACWCWGRFPRGSRLYSDGCRGLDF